MVDIYNINLEWHRYKLQLNACGRSTEVSLMQGEYKGTLVEGPGYLFESALSCERSLSWSNKLYEALLRREMGSSVLAKVVNQFLF